MLKTEEIVNIFILKKYQQYTIKDSEVMCKLQEKNIDVWSNGQRIVFMKEYRVSKDLLRWNTNDQSVISDVLEFIPNKLLNNLYFFIILDFTFDDTEIKLMINKIEKNDLIAKKVVLKNIDDVVKIPFLNDGNFESQTFNFDEKFRNKFTDFENSRVDERYLNLDLILENYFIADTDDFEEINIKKLLDTGDNNEY